MKLPGGWFHALAVVATFAAPFFFGQVSSQPGNETNGIAQCTRFFEMIVMGSGDKMQRSRADSTFVPTFSLYTRNNQERPETLRIASNGQVSSRFYDPVKDTKFITHGFLGRGTNKWILNLVEVLLEWADVNVIVVDWFRAAVIPYTRAAANTAVVGGQIARLITSLIESFGGNKEDFHLIGHSLGSHVVGYAGEAIPGIGRITGLDPAGPLFATTSPNHRLDPSDARFVDAIHTDKDCLGLRMPVGHVDFYPNGGTEQPGCAAMEDRRDDMGRTLAGLDSSFCSHFRAIKYFKESILYSPSSNANTTTLAGPCQFIGVLCNTYENFIEGNCDITDDENLSTAILGIDANIFPEQGSSNPPPRTYYLQTNAKKPYCEL